IMGRTSAGEESNQVIIEFWYDRDTGDALYHRREVGDTRPEDFYSAYEQGRGYSRVFGPNGIAQIYPENSVRSRALRPLVMMFERKLYVLQGHLKATARVTAPSGQVALISKHRINAPLDKDTSVTYWTRRPIYRSLLPIRIFQPQGSVGKKRISLETSVTSGKRSRP
ncbi:MAG: hypothetical protein WKH64_15390, partial [Chloroflexia bacterium]